MGRDERGDGAALAAAALTQVVFPWGYPAMLAGQAPEMLALAARNVTLVVLLGLAVAGLAEAVGGRPRAAVPDAPGVPDAGQPSSGATSAATSSRWSRSCRSRVWR